MRRLLAHFGGPEAVLAASAAEIRAVPGLRAGVAEAVARGADPAAVDRALAALDAAGGWILPAGSPGFPDCLRQIPDPPCLLYGRGSAAVLGARAVAVVGSREATSYGRKVAGALGRDLAAAGLTVVSGFARGIDTAAHTGALAGGGPTVAVLGCGVDVCYPRGNAELLERVVAGGAVISEYPPGTPPDARNFPPRNRIISGLARAVVVVEASRRSGSLITAACALEQGREVLAVPGSVFSYKSGGAHWLIKQGARLVEGAADVLEELGIAASGPTREEDREPPALEGPERRLFEALEPYPLHLDDLAGRSGLPVAQASGLLLQLALKDLVQVLPGQRYQRK
ncbi:DNA-protecting protein DprA [Dissulfurirhabdus thermomarina]|uniref:DNA-protecting protein DprA n=2 Tax=Dissulfurirhabdus thermomarina TaxID=1765737 RepID=A0A6N9TN41_DISTH|nr:DNA-protecting protein DprA [Dissulfurirhabdus thermomarina]NMX22614.1 DNA-protecting protein DprA [Dissulfurirhabdus thermomarina]